MGNKGSTEAPSGLTGAQEREVSQLPLQPNYLQTARPQENIYEDYTPAVSSLTRPAPSGAPPILPRPPPEHRRVPLGIERRSMTVVGRGSSDQRRSDPSLRRLSTSDAILTSTDPPPPLPAKQENLKAHIVGSEPREGEEEVELATGISVLFDRDVLNVVPDKLFEVKSEFDTKPLEGHATFDPRTHTAEFIPLHALHPGTTYTISLMGQAVATTQSSASTNITSTLITFSTCSPPPKSIGIKLRGQGETVEKLRITDFYDLYNSLVVWSTKQWGCSGEHVIGMYVEGEERGKLKPLKADHDVLRLQDNDIVIVDIKD